MNYNPIFSVFLGIFLFIWTCNNVFGPSEKMTKVTDTQTQVTIISEDQAAEGLDLKLLPALVKESKNAEEFEVRLNQPGGVNNLDLNNDGQVDYLKVDEYGDKSSGKYGFSLTTEVLEGEVQEVATIDMVQEGDQVKVSTVGNQNIYGPGYGYSGFYGLSSFFMWSYLLSPHSFYRSPYYYNNYPRGYQPYQRVNKNDYARQASRYEKTTTKSRGTASGLSPNKNRSANSGIKRSLKKPTSSQKSFQSRLKNRSVSSGGFGKKFGNTTSRSSKSSGFFGRRSVRGFSGFSRGFGGFGK